MKKIVSTLLTAVILISGTVLFAQPPGGGGQKNPGAKEIRQYFANNVKPELIKEQAKFMSVLSDKEIAELEKIKENWKNVRKQMHGKTPPENRTNTQKAHFSAFNAQVQKIVDAHPDAKAEYIKTLSAKKEQWMKDIEAIKEKYNMPDNKRGSKMMERIDDPAFILMWDPNRSFDHKKKGNSQGRMGKPGMKPNKMMISEPGIKIFPQPATTTITIRITGTKDKNINAAVYNASGKKMQELFNAKSSLPVLNFSLDISKWEKGTYTVKTKFDDRTMTFEFIVE
jgi:hypothetical protein